MGVQRLRVIAVREGGDVARVTELEVTDAREFSYGAGRGRVTGRLWRPFVKAVKADPSQDATGSNFELVIDDRLRMTACSMLAAYATATSIAPQPAQVVAEFEYASVVPIN